MPGSRTGIVLAMFLALAATASAGDCEKAKEIYSAGTKLLRFEARAQAFQQAVDLCPTFAEAHVNLADALENLAKLSKDDMARFNQLLDQAAAAYREALKHNENLFAAHLGLGDTYRVMGLYGQSEQAYKEALRLKPSDPRVTSGFEKIQATYAQESEGFKIAEDIIKHFQTSSKESASGPLMGFEERTVVKDRLRFSNILFDEWSAELKRGEAFAQLQEIGKALSSVELSACSFVVEGHTDNRGSPERNQKLSWDRAEAVKKYLIAHYRIDPPRIKIQGFGYSRPRFPNDTPTNMQRNRRVELLFIDRAGKD